MTQQKDLVDAFEAFIVGCKADGIWDAIKACCVMAGWNNLNGALIPLKGAAPTNFNFIAADYNRATGLKGNGSTKYLNSNRNNNADPQDNNHNSVYATTIASNGSYINARGAGSNDSGTNAIGVGPFFRSRSASVQVYSSSATGLIATNRSSAAQYTARFGGTNNIISTSSEPTLALNLFVFARNTNGTPEFFGDPRISFYSIGESLDLALLDARVSTLMTAIGAAIP